VQNSGPNVKGTRLSGLGRRNPQKPFIKCQFGPINDGKIILVLCCISQGSFDEILSETHEYGNSEFKTEFLKVLLRTLSVDRLIGFSKPGGCLYTDRVLRTRSQTQ
jgi:hypothetical protein